MDLFSDNNLEHFKNNLDNFANTLNLDSATRELGLSYIQAFIKTKDSKNFIEKHEIIIGCAILIASRAQILETISGEKIRGIGLSTSQILKSVFGEHFSQSNVKSY